MMTKHEKQNQYKCFTFQKSLNSGFQQLYSFHTTVTLSEFCQRKTLKYDVSIPTISLQIVGKLYYML